MEARNPITKRIMTVLSMVLLALVLSTTMLVTEAPVAEAGVPDCAPCHGDTHKPGEDNPHGYTASDAEEAIGEEEVTDSSLNEKSDGDTTNKKEGINNVGSGDIDQVEGVFFNHLYLSCPNRYSRFVIGDSLYVTSPDRDNENVHIIFHLFESGDHESDYEDYKSVLKSDFKDNAKNINFEEISVDKYQAFHTSCLIESENESELYVHKYIIDYEGDVYYIVIAGEGEQSNEFIVSDLVKSMSFDTEPWEKTYEKIKYFGDSIW